MMALSVCEDIQSRRIGLRQFAFWIIHLATSSPSRPASVAMTISLTSALESRELTALNCFEVWPITTSFILPGSMGRSSMRQLLYLSSYASGSARVTRCPSAHVTIYLSPTMQPLPLRLQPSTRAISFATDGFSVNTKVLAKSVTPFNSL